MPRVFISYRREDSAGHVGRLNEHLARAFGAKNVFFDVDDITPGADFAQTIRKAISKSDVVLAVIGKDWLASTDEQGDRRLDKDNDYVRFELATALASKVRVVPVFVRDAKIPSAHELPPDLSELATHHGLELRDERWSADVEDLVKSIGGRSIIRWMRRHKILTTTIGFFLFTWISVGFIFYLTQAPVQSVEQFFTLLAQGKMHEAYISTSSVFQARTDERRFQKMVERWRLDDNASASWSERELSSGRVVLKGEVRTKQREVIPMIVTLVKEGEDWRILSIGR
jgi:hypothetical protein